MIDLDPASRQQIEHILREYLAETEVRLVGSRAKGHAKPYADVDLLIMTDKPLSPECRALLNTAFEESNIPYKVDIIENCDLTQKFRAGLLKHSAQINTDI